jgi:hypothetical protein
MSLAMIAFLEPLELFRFMYFYRMYGSFVISIQILSTSAELTLRLPQRVILPWWTYSPVEFSDGVNPM